MSAVKTCDPAALRYLCTECPAYARVVLTFPQASSWLGAVVVVECHNTRMAFILPDHVRDPAKALPLDTLTPLNAEAAQREFEEQERAAVQHTERAELLRKLLRAL